MTMHRTLPLALALVSLAACNREKTDMSASDATGTAAAPVDTSSFEAPMTLSSGQFGNAMASSDAFEIQSAKLAATRATTAKVKAFAAMMIKDHAKSTADLKETATKLTPQLVLDPALSRSQQSDIDELRAATADTFDAVYARQQVAAHEKAVQTLDDYAAHGTSDPLKAFAAKTAAVVRDHLQQAKVLMPTP